MVTIWRWKRARRCKGERRGGDVGVRRRRRRMEEMR